MKQILFSVLFIMLFLLILPHQPINASIGPDWSALSFYGTLSVLSSFSEVVGNENDFKVQQMITPGLDYQYIADLEIEGQIGDFYLESTLYYPSNYEPELTLSLESRNWLIEHQIYELKLPNLITSFNTQKLEGFHLSRRNNSFHLFQGTKMYQTRSTTITVSNEAEITYTLFDSTAGDVVENSELVFLQGQPLRRYIDYKLNFLSGELKILTPLRVGSVIEVKYNFIPTGIPVNDRLHGGYYQYNFNRSYASVFYFDETKEIVTETEVDHEVVEEIKEETNRYVGGAVHLLTGPLTVTGEMALSDPDAKEHEYGANLTAKYIAPGIELDYKLTTATPDYQGIGVVPITAGEKHTASGEITFDPSLKMNLDFSRVKKTDEWTETITQNTETSVFCQVADKHWLTFSLDIKSVEEWGETNTENDVQVGWEYKINERSSLTYENSLHYTDKNKLAFKLNSYPIKIESEYKQYPEIIPYYGEYWYREFNTDLTWRPYTGISLTGDIDYLQAFEKSFKDSRRRIALTLLAAPTQKVSLRGNYVYFYNPDIKSQTLFYDLSSTLQLPFNSLLDTRAEKIEIKSEVLTNTDSSFSGNFSIPYRDTWNFAYNLTVDEKEVFLKDMNRIYQEDNDYNHILTATHQLNKLVSVQGYVDYLNSVTTILDSTELTTQRKFGLTATYLKDMHQFKYDLGYLFRSKKEKLTHLLNWTKASGQWQYNYSGELTQDLRSWQVTSHKEILDLNWIDLESPYRPSAKLNYQLKNEDGQHWEKYNLTTRMAYHFTWNRVLFAELGHIGTYDHVDTDKNYWALVTKIGLEYSF